MLQLTCPQCGSRNLRSSLTQSFGETLLKLVGILPLRCKECDARFSAPIWDLRNCVYARCPRCYRLDLTQWSTEYYHASTWWLFLMKLGAKRHRCAYCRHNFIAFRPAKLKYQGTRGVPIGGHDAGLKAAVGGSGHEA